MTETGHAERKQKFAAKFVAALASPLVALSLASVALLILVVLNRPAAEAVFARNSTEGKPVKFAPPPESSWHFIVSGDSRNCGDVVMPAIAAHSTKNYQPSFYWHLGDLRAIYMVDEDMAFADREANGQKLACSDYLKQAWPDFVKNQIYPFGKTPFYLGLGNHEVVPPKGHPLGSPEAQQPEINSAQFTSYFADWLLPPALKAQRVKDHDCDKPFTSPCIISARNYYHWIQGGVDFIYLDNASNIFGQEQLDWFKERVRKARHNDDIRSLVVGMHEALPDSISSAHAMCDKSKEHQANYPFEHSCREGKEVYKALLDFQNDFPDRHVYVLASHSHYFMDGIFKADKKPAERLHGWIVGTGGAVRYELPDNANLSNHAETNVYGYLVGTVDARGNVRFDFQRVTDTDVPADVRLRYQPAFVSWCFAHNSEVPDPKAPSAAPTRPYPTQQGCAKPAVAEASPEK